MKHSWASGIVGLVCVLAGTAALALEFVSGAPPSGPSTTNSIPRFRDTGGAVLVGSHVLIDDTDAVTGMASVAVTAFTRSEYLPSVAGPTGQQTALGQSTWSNSSLTDGSTQCAMLHWIVPFGYTGSPVLTPRVTAATAASDATAWVFSLQTYIIPWTNSGALMPATTYTSGNQTISLSSSFAQDDVVSVGSFSVTGTYAVGDHVMFEFCRIGADAADTAAISARFFGAKLAYSSTSP